MLATMKIKHEKLEEAADNMYPLGVQRCSAFSSTYCDPLNVVEIKPYRIDFFSVVSYPLLGDQLPSLSVYVTSYNVGQ